MRNPITFAKKKLGIDDVIEELNRDNAAAMFGTSFVVAHFYEDPLTGHRAVKFLNLQNFRAKYLNRHVFLRGANGNRKVPLGKYWLEHPS